MAAKGLIEIPVIDVAKGQEPALVSLAAEPARIGLLLESARRTYTGIGMRIADGRSRDWARRSTSPYEAAVVSVDRAMARTGAYLLNHSYEWGCTTGAADDIRTGGATMLRTLDWPFDGLGQALVAVVSDGGAGRYVSLTWPGFVGVLTGLAPGRFAAAINRPPLPLPGWGKPAGWIANRLRVARSTAMSPTHLLRLAFDRCGSFAEAVDLIRRTPICLPAIFTIAGMESGETMVIERTQDQAFELAVPAAANHWASPGPQGRPRNASSFARRAAMAKLLADCPDWSFGWLKDPVLQKDTRVAVMANPRSGRLLVQGLEKTGPVTRILDRIYAA